jgi:hypothetical protein
MEQVNDKSGLQSLCLVSRRMCIFAVPILYCKITLNLSVDSHRQLLHRLG